MKLIQLKVLAAFIDEYYEQLPQKKQYILIRESLVDEASMSTVSGLIDANRENILLKIPYDFLQSEKTRFLFTEICHPFYRLNMEECGKLINEFKGYFEEAHVMGRIIPEAFMSGVNPAAGLQFVFTLFDIPFNIEFIPMNDKKAKFRSSRSDNDDTSWAYYSFITLFNAMFKHDLPGIKLIIHKLMTEDQRVMLAEMMLAKNSKEMNWRDYICL